MAEVTSLEVVVPLEVEEGSVEAHSEAARLEAEVPRRAGNIIKITELYNNKTIK
jgi:hypothetical protein